MDNGNSEMLAITEELFDNSAGQFFFFIFKTQLLCNELFNIFTL